MTNSYITLLVTIINIAIVFVAAWLVVFLLKKKKFSKSRISYRMHLVLVISYLLILIASLPIYYISIGSDSAIANNHKEIRSNIVIDASKIKDNNLIIDGGHFKFFNAKISVENKIAEDKNIEVQVVRINSFSLKDERLAKAIEANLDEAGVLKLNIKPMSFNLVGVADSPTIYKYVDNEQKVKSTVTMEKFFDYEIKIYIPQGMKYTLR